MSSPEPSVEPQAPLRPRPVRWKYHAVVNFVLSDNLPPRHGAL